MGAMAVCVSPTHAPQEVRVHNSKTTTQTVFHDDDDDIYDWWRTTIRVQQPRRNWSVGVSLHKKLRTRCPVFLCSGL